MDAFVRTPLYQRGWFLSLLAVFGVLSALYWSGNLEFVLGTKKADTRYFDNREAMIEGKIEISE